MESSNPQWLLEQALAALLVRRITLSKGGQPYIVPIVDEVTDGTSFPYCTPAEETKSDASTLGQDEHELTWTLETWSKALNRREIKDIMGQIEALVQAGPIELGPGWHAELMPRQPELDEIFRGPQKSVKLGVQRFRILVERR